jgi:hypothetical protein
VRPDGARCTREIKSGIAIAKAALNNNNNNNNKNLFTGKLNLNLRKKVVNGALTSPTGGGRSVGIVRSRTKAMEFSFSLVVNGTVEA